MTKIERVFKDAQKVYNAAAEEAKLIYEKAIMNAEWHYIQADEAARSAYLDATWAVRQQEGQKRARALKWSNR